MSYSYMTVIPICHEYISIFPNFIAELWVQLQKQSSCQWFHRSTGGSDVARNAATQAEKKKTASE